MGSSLMNGPIEASYSLTPSRPGRVGETLSSLVSMVAAYDRVMARFVWLLSVFSYRAITGSPTWSCQLARPAWRQLHPHDQVARVRLTAVWASTGTERGRNVIAGGTG